MPSLGGSRRRHAKQPPQQFKKTTPPPPITVSTNSSAENTNASTNPRYDVYTSSLRPSKRPGLINSKSERPCSGYKESKAMGLLEKENLSVFAYMQDEEEEDSDSTGEGDSQGSARSSPSPTSPPRLVDLPQRSPRYSDLEVRAIQDGVHRAWGRASLHSDSGISVRSHSPDQDSPVAKDKMPFDHSTPMIEESGCENEKPEANALQISPHLESRGSEFCHRYWPSADTGHSSGPEAYQVSLPQMIPHRPVSREDEMPEMHIRSSSALMHLRSRQGSTSSPSTRTGYNLIASNISARDDALLKPIYRKFEILNNRMLLYLQDEIAQMEEDLKELDAAIAMEDVDLGKRGPASRRSEAKLPSQLQWHRLDLLGRSFAKVEQYNRALTSYSNLTKTLDPASTTDISTYRQWIAEHTPIAEPETCFLQKENDLVSIKPKVIPGMCANAASSSTNDGTKNLAPSLKIEGNKRKELETPTIIISFALISTLIVFHFVPSILARLVISTLVGLAALAILQPEGLYGTMTLKNCKEGDWKSGVAVYCAIMTGLALVVT